MPFEKFLYLFQFHCYEVNIFQGPLISAQWSALCWSQNKGLAQMFACSKLVQCGQGDCVKLSGFPSYENDNSAHFAFTSSPWRHPPYMAKSGWCLTKSLSYCLSILAILSSLLPYYIAYNLWIMHDIACHEVYKKKSWTVHPIHCAPSVYVWQLCLLSDISFLYEYLTDMVNYSSTFY